MERDDFVAAVRHALVHLDDYLVLRSSPLLPVLFPDTTGSPASLQRLLIENIEALRTLGEPNATRWREVLHSRYIERMLQSDVAFQYGYSVRQLRREQVNAIELLADQMIEKYMQGENGSTELSKQAGTSGSRQVDVEHTTNENDSGLEREIHWLKEGFPSEITRVGNEVRQVIEDAAPLAAFHNTRLDYTPARNPICAAVPPVPLRQVLLMLLTSVIPTAGAAVRIIERQEGEQSATITILSQGGAEDSLQEVQSALHVASSLLSPFGAELSLSLADGAQVTIALPLSAEVRILLVDDNPDARQLFHRYANNTRFDLIPTRDAMQAVQLAIDYDVRAIVLDIMMPTADGWTVLARLQHHPQTRNIPVAACSILPQERLASFLGASLFLQKPVDRERFLTALDTLTASQVQAHN